MPLVPWPYLLLAFIAGGLIFALIGMVCLPPVNRIRSSTTERYQNDER